MQRHRSSTAAAEEDPLANRVRHEALTAHGEGSGHPVSQGHTVHGLQALGLSRGPQKCPNC